MSGFGKKRDNAKPVKTDDKSAKQPPKVSDDDDAEDGGNLQRSTARHRRPKQKQHAQPRRNHRLMRVALAW